MNSFQKTLVILSVIFLIFFGLYEVLLGFPFTWWLYLAVTVIFALSIFLSFKKQLPLRTLVIPCLAIVSAWVLYFVHWNSRKPFLHDLYSIELGMSELEVRKIMSAYMEGTGWPALYGTASSQKGKLTDLGSGASYSTTSNMGELTIEESLVFRHSNEGAYNADWGIVSFENGRVVDVSFSPD